MDDVGLKAVIDTDDFNVPASASAWRALRRTRITVWWALELAVREASFPPTLDVYIDEQGNRRWEIGDGRGLARKWVMDSFRAFCSDHGVVPRNPYSPLAKDFMGEEWQSTFTISAQEFEKWLSTYLELASGDMPAHEPLGKAENGPQDLGLFTSDLAIVLGRKKVAGWDIAEWKNNLEDPPDWLRAHRLSLGKRGNDSYQSRWSPLAIARALVDGPCGKRQKASVDAFDAVFASSELAPWREPWRIFRELKAEQESFGK